MAGGNVRIVARDEPYKVVSQTPTITAGAYAADDALGGKLTFAGVCPTEGGVVIIEDIVVTDKGKQAAGFDIVLFDRTFTPTADNAAFDPSDADLANCIGHIPITAGEYALFNDNAVATKRNVLIVLSLAGADLFAQLVVRDTPTYTSTSDLTIKIACVRIG